MLVNDTRRIRIFRIFSNEGIVNQESSGDIYQEIDGSVKVSGLWSDGLIPSPEDLLLLAKDASVSPLEYLRIKLSRCSGIKVEVYE